MFFNRKKKEDKYIANDDRIKVDTTTITTMVGVDTLIEGTLKTKSSIRINGTIIGDVRADGIVVLTKTGKIVGTIEAESIIVAGVVEGNMSIRDKVNVEATGEIYGDVITKKFVIDEESIFQGNCIMNRIGQVTEKLVPFMAAIYILLAIGVVVINLKAIPSVFGAIFEGAFNPSVPPHWMNTATALRRMVPSSAGSRRLWWNPRQGSRHCRFSQTYATDMKSIIM